MPDIKTQGTTFQIENAASPNEYTTMAGVKSITGLGSGQAAEIDVTDFDSTAKEFIQGLADEGSLQVTYNYDPDDVRQIQLETARNAQSSLDFQIVLASGTLKYFRFTGYVLAIDKSLEADGVVQAVATIRISGSVTKASS
jgi:hypothetical protein